MAGRESPLKRLPGDRTTRVVVLIAAVALGARLLFLGSRIAHQDEARVAFWTLRYLESGAFEYRPIIHGPFLPVVTRWSFALLGPSDFAARLPVALVGTLLPVSALLLRDRLRDAEVAALSLLLASAPILLYYSRFYRSDVPTAAFAFVAFGAFVRAYDREQARYLFLGSGALALSFTAKENALLYPLCWLGGLVLLFDHRLFVARLQESTPLAVAKRRARTTLLGLWRWFPYIVIAAVEFLVVIVFFYAPRGGGYVAMFDHGYLGLWTSLEQLLQGRPDMFVAVVDEALRGSVDKLVGQWIRSPDNAYVPFLTDFLVTMRAGALVVSLLAVLGFVVDRYSGSGPRDVVAIAGYWGVASVFGYPIATDIQAPWATVHAVVPLAIPAAVGIALIYRWGVESLADGDEVGVTVAVVVLFLLGAQVGFAAYGTVYQHPQDPNNELVQYAQSSSADLKPMLTDTVRSIARENRGIDVLFYGTTFNSENESAADWPGYRGGGWYARLPLAWYFEVNEYRLARDGAELNVSSRASPETIASADPSRLPPVVVAFADTPNKQYDDNEADIAGALGGYTRYQFQRYGWGSPFVLYVKNDYDPSIEKRVPLPAWKQSGGSTDTGDDSPLGDGMLEFPRNVTNETIGGNGTETDARVGSIVGSGDHSFVPPSSRPELRRRPGDLPVGIGPAVDRRVEWVKPLRWQVRGE
ncbi:MAG: hypothetical protein ACI9YT_000760 [Halobacteriales archaeon]|jgi:uncharacterized protein (TIGR03663 family)